MAPIILKVKGNTQSSPFGNLDSTEDLSKTWRVCTKVKDSLENGSRLENLSWRLWYSHNNQKKKTAPPSFKIPDNFDFNKKKKTVQEKEIEYKRKLKLQQQKQAQQIIQEQQLKLERLASDQAQSQVVELNPTFKNYIYPTNETDMTQQAIHTDPSFVNQNWPIEDYSLPCNPQEFYNEGSALYVSAESMPPIPIGTLHNRILATLPKETLESAERFILSSAENELFLQQPFVQSTPTSPFFSFPLVQQPIQQSMIQPPAYHPYTPPMSSILNDTNEKALCQSKSLPASRASSPVFHPPSPLSPNKKNTPTKRNPISTSPADGKAPICSNCNTTTTPLWRRSGDDELLCNACGLYLKLHNTPRPKHFKPQSLRKDSKDEENLIQPVCSNCSTSTTPLWRRDVDGLPLCNACGLYLKLHHEKRPLSMKTDNIKKRQRTENVSNDKLKKMKAKSLEENEGTYQFMEDIVHTNNSSSSFSPLGQFNCTA